VTASAVSPPAARPLGKSGWLWLSIATMVLVAAVLAPTPPNLTPPGQRALAVLLFAVIIWVTEAVSYPVSAALLIAVGALVVGLGPGVNGARYGTGRALAMYLEGFASTAVAVVGGALVLSAAMKHTGLDTRVALTILRRTGRGPRGILVGALLVGVVLAFFVPSTTARAGAMVPIMGGMVAACGLPRNSRLAAMLMIAAAHVTSIWNVAIKTAAAQNLVAIGLIQRTMGITVTWGTWFLNAVPWAIVMTLALAVVVIKVIPPENTRLSTEPLAAELPSLPAMTSAERRLVAISVALLAFWVTEGQVHPLDTATSTCIAVAFILLPRVGVLSWSEAERLVPWGTLLLFAVGISIGSVLIATGAAKWVADVTLTRMGVASMSVVGMVALLSAFNIVLHLGFASATGLASALIPIMIAFFTSLQRPDINPLGMVLIQQFVVSFGFLLPVNSPQNMVAYGSGAFTTRDFLRTGIWMTVIAYLLVLVMSMTYWRWTGLLVR
jgi:solute carrier family 13 (sodium-dependent dicarboxylate transporter), member 2/3/5